MERKRVSTSKHKHENVWKLKMKTYWMPTNQQVERTTLQLLMLNFHKASSERFLCSNNKSPPRKQNKNIQFRSWWKAGAELLLYLVIFFYVRPIAPTGLCRRQRWSSPCPLVARAILIFSCCLAYAALVSLTWQRSLKVGLTDIMWVIFGPMPMAEKFSARRRYLNLGPCVHHSRALTTAEPLLTIFCFRVLHVGKKKVHRRASVYCSLRTVISKYLPLLSCSLHYSTIGKSSNLFKCIKESFSQWFVSVASWVDSSVERMNKDPS